MTNEIKILISVVAFLLMELFQIGVNSKKYRRIRQLPASLMSIILVIVGVGTWLKNSYKAAEICNSVEYLENADILYINASLLLGYCIVRLGFIFLFSKVCKDQTLLKYLSLDFYEYEDLYDEWFLRKQFINFRRYFLVICISLNVVTGVFLSVTWIFGKNSPMWVLLFPAAVVAIVNEFFNYINGQTKEEFEHSIYGEDSDSRRVSNYFKLREVLERILPEPLLATYNGAEHVRRETAADLLKQFADSSDEKNISI